MKTRDATRWKKTYNLYRQEPRLEEGSSCVICNTILNGAGPPASDLGLIDDLYIDLDTMDLYGPKTESGWGDPIALASGEKFYQWNELGLSRLNTTGSVSIAGNQGSSYSVSSVGSDVYFYVSGSKGTPGAHKSVFGGDVFFSGSLLGSSSVVIRGSGNDHADLQTDVIESDSYNTAVTIRNRGPNPLAFSGSGESPSPDPFVYDGRIDLLVNSIQERTIDNGLRFVGPSYFYNGLTGSLTKLLDGTDYIVAGSGIEVEIGNKGQITIGSTVSPGGLNTHVQFNDNNEFGGSPEFTFNNSTNTLQVENVIIDGDLTVNGTTTTVNTVNLDVKDSVIGLGFSSGTVAQTTGDRGFIGGLADELNVAFMWKENVGEFVIGRTESSATGSLEISSYENLHLQNLQASIVTASLGFTGSLTKLIDGTDYLRAGSGIDISTGSSGYVTITSTAVTSPASPDTSVQFNNSNAFDGDATFTFVVGQDAYTNPMGKLYLTGTLAQGDGTKALGWHSHAEGALTVAYGMNSHAEGSGAVTGDVTEFGGDYAHAEGNGTIAYGTYSHAEGNSTVTGGRWNLTGTWSGGGSAHAEGTSTIAWGQASHAEGSSTKTGAMDPEGNWSGGQFAHAEGNSTIAFGESSHAEGEETIVGARWNLTGSWSGGQSAHAEGWKTKAYGNYSHAEGTQTKTGGMDSSGNWSGGLSAHAEGVSTTAYGNYSHAEGNETQTGMMDTSGNWSGGDIAHAEGSNTIAFGYGSHAEGYHTVAIGYYSHSEGGYTIASGSYQNVVGKYNKRGNTDSLFIVGNGDGEADTLRSDILLVNSGSVMVGSASLAADTFFYVGTKDAADKAVFSGTVKSVGGFSGSLTKLYDGQDYLLAGNNVTLLTSSIGQVQISTTGLAPSNAQYLTLATDTTLSDERQFTVGNGLSGQDAGAGGEYTVSINDSVVATISGSTFTGVVNFNQGLSGSLTKLTNNDDYLVAGSGISLLTGANGSITISSTSITTPGSPDTGIQFNNGGTFDASANFTFANDAVYLSGSLSNGNQTEASGQSTHAEGYLTTASYLYAHSEGYDTLASGEASHVEGKWSESIGSFSHAEGVLSVAVGNASHAEGSGSLATGMAAHSEGHLTSAPADYSHTEGWATITSGSWSHAEGKATITSGSWSHAEGVFTIARGEASHAEGSGSLAIGTASHAAGKDTTALGDFSHAGGIATLASGYASTAIGSGSISAGNFSFAAGEYTVASGSAQSVFGKYNKHDNIDSLFVVGNGSSNESRSDLFIINSGTLLIGSASLAPDTFFYIGTNVDATVSRFDGDVVVSGTLNVKNGNDISTLSVVNSKVGIGTSTPGYELEVVGEFAATVKSFVIDHPNKPGWKLRHGTLEGPENGIYVRGRTKQKIIKLPEYWKNLVDESSITVHITPIGIQKVIYVKSVDIDEAHVECADLQEIEFFYNIQAQRKDYVFDIEYQCDN